MRKPAGVFAELTYRNLANQESQQKQVRVDKIRYFLVFRSILYGVT